MGKLIEADVVSKQIWRKHKETEDSYDLCVDELKEVFCGIVALVDEQPTAYDPDKVAEQLEDYSNADEAEMIGTIPVIELDDAIKIVKGGGVDGN